MQYIKSVTRGLSYRRESYLLFATSNANLVTFLWLFFFGGGGPKDYEVGYFRNFSDDFVPKKKKNKKKKTFRKVQLQFFLFMLQSVGSRVQTDPKIILNKLGPLSFLDINYNEDISWQHLKQK